MQPTSSPSSGGENRDVFPLLFNGCQPADFSVRFQVFTVGLLNCCPHSNGNLFSLRTLLPFPQFPSLAIPLCCLSDCQLFGAGICPKSWSLYNTMHTDRATFIIVVIVVVYTFQWKRMTSRTMPLLSLNSLSNCVYLGQPQLWKTG